MCDAENRIGRSGAHEIRAHPFFRGVDWANIKKLRAPFIPELRSITDTSYFPVEDLKSVPTSLGFMMQVEPTEGGRQRDLAFIGYTYKRFDDLTRRNAL